MSAAFLALIVASGAGIWIYTKLQQRTGYGNNSSAIKGGIISAVVIFLVVFSIGLMILK